ncbi:MAG: cytidylyltransferase domain-containing protein [Candidatus Nanopelagicales bacterium]
MLTVAIMIGRKNSKGLPGKNMRNINGHPMAYWPIKAAKESTYIDHIFVSTDDKDIKDLALKLNVRVIDRPDQLALDNSLAEETFVHAYGEVVKKLEDNVSTKIGLLVLLMANAPTVNAQLIDQGILAMQQNPDLDSAVTVSKYNMWSPTRARKIENSGLLTSFYPLEVLNEFVEINCDRDSQGDVYFADMGASIIRPRNLQQLTKGMLPQKWMGRKISPIINEGGLDIDYEFQIGQAEFWLKNQL